MRQIGDMTARTPHNFGAMGDEAIEFTGQWRNLGWKRALELARASFADARQPLADAAKRHQPEMDLESNRGKQPDAERGKPPKQGPIEARHIRLHLALVARDGEAEGSGLLDSLCRAGECDAANVNPQILTIGTGGIAPKRIVGARRE